MKRWVILFALVAFAGLVRAEAPASAPATQRADQMGALSAAAKTDKNGEPNKRFMDMHKKFIERGKEPADVLFLGDSITEGWLGKGKDVWSANYEKYKAANFGISGDRTQHVLWRIQNGELDNIKPKVTVLMLGTNNLAADDADSIAKADEEIVKIIRDKTGSKVLLLAIFPRGAKADDPKTKQFREKLDAINAQLKAFSDGTNVRYLDIGKAFLEDDGSISKEVMADGLHPTKEGYERWVKAMNPTLEEMLK